MADTTLPGLLSTGDHASRPAASAVGTGALYSCTDHALVYQTDGSSWTTWASLGGGGIPETLIDAAGDLIVGSAADTAARLAIGANATVLTSNGTTATWAAPAAGGGGLPLDSYAIDGTYGDDFTAGSLSGSWTRRNFVSGNETYQVGKDATYIRLACGARAVGDAYHRTAPASDWTIGIAFIPRFYGNNVPGFGLTVIDSSGTGVFCNLYSAPFSMLIYGVTTYTTYGGSFAQVGGGSTAMMNSMSDVLGRKVWMTLRKSGTNYYTSISTDGEAFSPESAAFAWTGTVDRVGFGFGPLGNVQGVTTAAVVDVDWFNKLA